MLRDTVRNTILKNKLIAPGETVLLALSGGSDSVALLLCLLELSKQLRFGVTAAHLNHSIRGSEAQRDADFAKNLCDRLKVPFCMETADVPAYAAQNGKTLEQAAREVRYDFLKAAAKILRADKIATAHHKRDRAETILLNIARGTGLSGICAMDYARGSIIRPMLDADKSQVLMYLDQKGQDFVTDSTNLKRDGARNKIRLDVIPYFEKNINLAFVDSLISMGDLVREDERLLSDMAVEALRCSRLKRGYDAQKLLLCKRPILARALRIACAEAGAKADIERVHIDMLKELMTKQSGASLNLPRVKASMVYGEIVFEPAEEPVYLDYISSLNLSGETKTPFGSYICEPVDGNGYIKSREVAYMDADRLGTLAVVRPRYEGDVYAPIGLNGSKKLKEFYIDKKIERAERDRPLIAIGSDILYVPGFFVSQRVAVRDDTQRMVKLKFKKEQL